MTETARLRLPILAAAQAQKHVTHNEALTALDTLVQAAVLDKDLTAPPGSPAEGDCYIVAGGGGTATGAWTSWEKRVARYQDGQWISFLPGAGDGAGWLVWVMDEDAMYRFDGANWALAGIEGPQEPQGPAGADGADGADGAPGQGIEPDATGTLAERAAYDGAAQGFVYLRTDVLPFELYVKASGASGDWAGPSEMGASTFLALADTPAAYAGAAGKMLAVKSAEDGLELVDAPTGDVPADLDLLLAQLALNDADLMNVAQFLGDAGNRVADSFDALTYVDTGASTNLDTGEAGVLKPTTTASSESTGDPTTTGGDGATQINRSVQIDNDKTVTTIGVNSSSAITVTVKIAKRNSPGNYDIVVSEQFSHGGGGWQDFTLSTPYAVPSSGDYFAGGYSSSLYGKLGGQLHAAASGNVTGSGQSFTESGPTNSVCIRFEYAEGGTENMTALSAALTAAAVPAAMRVVSRVEFVDSITLGTDITYEVSRDNGVSWTAATMNDRFTAGGLHVLESDDIDVSGQPSGTQVKWRIKTLTGKMAEINDMYVYWA